MKFRSYRKRNEVIRNRRKLAGKRKSIMEDLTGKNVSLLSKVRESENVKSAWTMDGRIFALSKKPGSIEKD